MNFGTPCFVNAVMMVGGLRNLNSGPEFCYGVGGQNDSTKFLGLHSFVSSFKQDFFNLFGVIKDYVFNFEI